VTGTGNTKKRESSGAPVFLCLRFFAVAASGRKAASGGNPLPLFWHCRLADPLQSPGNRGFLKLARRLL
jgi:hypothetical protein